MASIILANVGGATFCPIGSAIGALVGAKIDGALQSSLNGRTSSSSRLGNLSVQSSIDGAFMPKIFGSAKIAGQVIWADNFKETTIKRTVGGKGGQKVKEYKYTISFAIGLCQGPISHIGRTWVNGKEIDLSQYNYRLHTGNNSNPDPLMEAILGMYNCPNYNDIAYIVFEDLPLDVFGDRIPQFSFEIFAQENDAQSLENLIKGVCLIPATGEFAYATTPIIEQVSKGNENYLNSHHDHEKTDFVCAIENLANDLPNAKSISLVNAWFGTSIDAATCQIIPKTEINIRNCKPRNWDVAGLSRNNAARVSQINGKNAYGGSIDDKSIIESIIYLNSKGFKVTFNPFIMMDCANYPWRGRIKIAPNLENNSGANAAINTFYGNVLASHFAISGQNISYSGPNEFSYSRFILHQAALCKAAGGVDSFLIGSELIGLTRARSSQNIFPFVDKLIHLAGQVRAILGANCKIGYGADWTEYGSYVVGNDLTFPLDKLWADNNINFIGIDYYAPISDRANTDAPLSIAQLQANIEAGIAYDYYYVDENARNLRQKTLITDGAYNEAWIYRQKDLRNFWQNSHYPRFNGVRNANPTQWIAKSKPIRLMELGYPAIDKGANQPSVFPDAKSIENGIPHFSNGNRDDLEQRRALYAFLTYWDDSKNPVSNLYTGRMIDMDYTHIWAWDARPYPQFPSLKSVWGDGDNYAKGHWLMGRLGGGKIADLLKYILQECEITNYEIQGLERVFNGFVIENQTNARAILNELIQAFNIGFYIKDGKFIFTDLAFSNVVQSINQNDLILFDDGTKIQKSFAKEDEIDGLNLRLYSIEDDYDTINMFAGSNGKNIDFALPLICGRNMAASLASGILQNAKNLNLVYKIRLENSRALALEIGDIIDIGLDGIFAINAIEYGAICELSLSKLGKISNEINSITIQNPKPSPIYFGEPLAFALDLPMPFGGSGKGAQIYIASNNFDNIDVRLGDKSLGVCSRAASIGNLLNPIPLSAVSQNIRAILGIKMLFGAKLPNTGNLAILRDNQIIDIINYQSANLIAQDTYNITNFVRGLNGINEAPNLQIGDYAILLDEACVNANIDAELWGAEVMLDLQSNIVNPPISYQLPCTFYGNFQKPWAVCHIKAKRINNAIEISFLRRMRGDNDNWQTDVLSQESNYEIRILDNLGAIKRKIQTTNNIALYNDELPDFGTKQSSLEFEIIEFNQSIEGHKNRQNVIIL